MVVPSIRMRGSIKHVNSRERMGRLLEEGSAASTSVKIMDGG
jgi:hypothetical protein